MAEGDAPSLDSVQEVRLLALLQDLVKQRGRPKTAEVLGVNYKTLVGIIESGRLTRRVEASLEKLLLARDVAELQEDREVMVALARRVAALEDRDRGLDDRVREAVERAWERRSRRPAGGPDSGAGPERNSRRPAYPRLHPTVMTLEREDGEEDVYGGTATELVVQWRQARSEFLAATGWLGRDEAEETMRSLEVRLIGEHGMTLPPALETWDDSTRRSELWQRERALRRLNRERWRRRLWIFLTLRPGLCKLLYAFRRACVWVGKAIPGGATKSSCRRVKPR